MRNYINGIAITNNGIRFEDSGSVMSLVGYESTPAGSNKRYGTFERVERHEDEYEKYIRSRGRRYRRYY